MDVVILNLIKSSLLACCSDCSKAGRVDASLKKLTATTVAAYNGRAPSKTDIFTEGNQGATVSFSCWIRRSVKVPNL
jgi:hypothetical protein